MEIIIKAFTGMKWIIDTAALSQADRDFIRSFDPVIYWSDTDCRYWAFDTKLPSGRWLENMDFTFGDDAHVTAFVA